MKRLFYTVAILLCVLLTSKNGVAQNKPLSLGITSDIQMESPVYIYYGLQGKYDFNPKNAIQAQLGYSNNKIGFLGVDYVHKAFNIGKITNTFIGAGTSFEFLTSESTNYFTLNMQAGFEFNLGRYSPYLGYKPKFYVNTESLDTSNFTLGLRYRL